ncbi:unnamed protein product [Psylliodes chrysocephalus]|uniref:CRAL-TRIO domain-containing protein n=1 Tax=Psylliodes chrysocephalus TaxID=3402493 RepID=A0A9P0CKH0_9CUCU|nr:unnamed protein product [Psylliodes chrysocephala]
MELSASKKEILLDRENLISSEQYEEQKKELRETDSMRQDGLNQLRNWISQNPDIENCLTDDSFLVRFLRVRKYSIPMAQQTLLKYLNLRQTFKSALCNLDYTEPRTLDLLEKGYVYVSPFRDCNGRRVIIYNLNSINVQTVTSLDIQRADMVTFETLLEDEECQIMGVTHIIQGGNIGPSIIPIFCTKDFGYLIKWGEQSFPMRHKSFIITSISSIIKYIFETTKSLITPKLRKRIWMNESLEKLHQKVGKHCLPLELGGTIPAKQMMDLWREELEAKRERLLSFDKIILLSDKGIITRRNSPRNDETGIGSVSGSFRKLNID